MRGIVSGIRNSGHVCYRIILQLLTICLIEYYLFLQLLTIRSRKKPTAFIQQFLPPLLHWTLLILPNRTCKLWYIKPNRIATDHHLTRKLQPPTSSTPSLSPNLPVNIPFQNKQRKKISQLESWNHQQNNHQINPKENAKTTTKIWQPLSNNTTASQLTKQPSPPLQHWHSTTQFVVLTYKFHSATSPASINHRLRTAVTNGSSFSRTTSQFKQRPPTKTPRIPSAQLAVSVSNRCLMPPSDMDIRFWFTTPKKRA